MVGWQLAFHVFVISLLSAWTLIQGSGGGAQSFEKFKGQLFLPNFAVPKHYDFFLRPDLSSLKFSGTIGVTLDIVADTKFLVLNAKKLNIDANSTIFTSSSSKNFRPSQIISVDEDEILVLQFNKALPRGNGTLRIGFHGTMTGDKVGFYVTYNTHNGETKPVAVTQFQPKDARRLFPCWDEPALKATFKVTVEVLNELVALGNMPMLEEKLDGPNKIVSFQETPIMSTYLLAIAIGYFNFIEDSAIDGVKVRFYSGPDNIDQVNFALNVAVKSLKMFKRYFDTPYAMPKLDLVAVPDLEAGGMENFGLVIFNEKFVLVDKDQLTFGQQKIATTLVAHEIAHQWFGNLVTMQWWTDLWLNEAFATWAGYFVLDGLFPNWDVWTLFIYKETQGAFDDDALAKSRPVMMDITNINQIGDTLFEPVIYDKGASIVRMIQSYLTPEGFQKALGSFIKKYRYSNARSKDLWNVLESKSGKPMAKLLSSWTSQPGFPVINAKLNGKKLQLEQTRFFSDGSSGDGQWIVPITFFTSSNCGYESFLMENKSMEIDISGIMSSSAANKGAPFWLKVNANQTGYYIVKYDDELLTGLQYTLRSNLLSPSDRIGLLDDAFKLCIACKKTMSSLLSLVASYINEEDHFSMVSKLMKVSDKIVNAIVDAAPESLPNVKEIFSRILQHPAKFIGWDPKDGEGLLTPVLREKLLITLAKLGHNDTVNEGVRRFHSFLNDRRTSLLNPSTRKAAYVAVMQQVNSSNKQGYESLLKIYRENEEDKLPVLSYLTSSPDPNVVLDALNFLLTSEVDMNIASRAIDGISWEGRDISWVWMKENWKQLTSKGQDLVSKYQGSIIPKFSSEDKINEAKQLFSSLPCRDFGYSFKNDFEAAMVNEKFVNCVKNEQLGVILKELVN